MDFRGQPESRMASMVCREPNPLSIRRVCQYMVEWTFGNVKLSGTAIIKDFITVSS